MNNTYLANAFSLQMLNGDADISIRTVSSEEIAESGFVSAVGHSDTAAVLSDLLGKPVEANRISIALEKGDTLYVAQLTGGRLPEGSTTLPDGFSFRFQKVEII